MKSLHQALFTFTDFFLLIRTKSIFRVFFELGFVLSITVLLLEHYWSLSRVTQQALLIKELADIGHIWLGGPHTAHRSQSLTFDLVGVWNGWQTSLFAICDFLFCCINFILRLTPATPVCLFLPTVGLGVVFEHVYRYSRSNSHSSSPVFAAGLILIFIYRSVCVCLLARKQRQRTEQKPLFHNFYHKF